MSDGFVYRELWTGRSDLDEPASGGRWHQVVQPFHADSRGGTTLIGFAVDEGVRRNEGRTGAADGPVAFRTAMRQFPRMGSEPLWDAGDVACQSGDLAASQRDLATRVDRVLQQQSFPLVIGGGHEMAWGSFQGLLQSHRDLTPLLVLNLDSHLDLRPTHEPNSGTPFLQMLECSAEKNFSMHYAAFGVSRFANTRGLFDRADNYHSTYVLDEQLQLPADLARSERLLDELLERQRAVYLSVCLDVLPAYVAPGVSAPATLGVPLAYVERLIDRVLASKKLVLADIAELNPKYDRDHCTARIAARLATRMVAGHAAGPTTSQ